MLWRSAHTVIRPIMSVDDNESGPWRLGPAPNAFDRELTRWLREGEGLPEPKPRPPRNDAPVHAGAGTKNRKEVLFLLALLGLGYLEFLFFDVAMKVSAPPALIVFVQH